MISGSTPRTAFDTSSGFATADTIDRLNQALTLRQIGARYATTMYGHLSPAGELVYCSAGHNPAIVYGADGVRRLEAGGVPVGLFPGAPYESSQLTLKPGDTIVSYSDGVTEALDTSGEEFGEERLIEVIKAHHGESASDLLGHVIEAVQTFARGAEQYDDVTALVVRYLGPPPA